MAVPPELTQATRRARGVELRVLEILGDAAIDGPERSVAELVRALPPQVRAIALLPRDGALAERLRRAGAPVHVAPVDDDDGLSLSVERAVELVRRARVDVIHAHHPNAHAVAAIASAVTGVPTLATLHAGVVWMREWEVLTRGWSRAACVCEAVRAHALLLGAPPGQLALVPYGVDTASFGAGDGAALRAGWELPREGRAVGVVGRLSAVDGAGEFLEACAALARRDDALRFVVPADGPARARCDEAMRTPPLSGRIRLVPAEVPRPQLLAALDLAVWPARDDLAPLPLLEAMAAGVPTVATRVESAADHAVDREHARLVRPRDAAALADSIASLLADRAGAAAMAHRARARIEARFDLARHVERVLDELARTARGGGRRLRRDPAAALAGA